MPKHNIISPFVMLMVKAWNKAILKLSNGGARLQNKEKPMPKSISAIVMRRDMVWNRTTQKQLNGHEKLRSKARSSPKVI